MLQIELLMSENKTLKQSKFDMESKCGRQQEYIKTATEEISRIEAALFNAKSEVEIISDHSGDLNSKLVWYSDHGDLFAQ